MSQLTDKIGRLGDCVIKLRQLVAVLPWSDNLLFWGKIIEDNAIMFYSQVSSRIRRIRMFVEQWNLRRIYDPIGVAHGNCQFDAINMLSLRDKLKTEKFLLSTGKIGRL